MTPQLPFALLLAFVWGCSWALFLQCTNIGRFLAARRAWLTVAVGIGADLLILWPILGTTLWLPAAGVIVLSSLGVIARSLWNEHLETQELLRAASRRVAPPGEQP